MNDCRFGHSKNCLDSAAKTSLLENFDDDHNELVAYGHVAGVEALDALLDRLGGAKVHIPRPESFWGKLEREVRDTSIRARFRGNNYAQLGLEYGLDERQVRRIVHEEARPRATYRHRERISLTLHLTREQHDRLEAIATCFEQPSLAAIAVMLLERAMRQHEAEVPDMFPAAVGAS